MASVLTAGSKPKPSKRQRDIIHHDEEIGFEINLEVTQKALDGPAAFIHIGIRKGEKKRRFTLFYFGPLRAEVSGLFPSGVEFSGQFLDHPSADIVAGTGVRRTGIS